MIVVPWTIQERAAFWARVLFHPRRKYRGGPMLPMHPTDLARITALLKIAAA